MSISKSRSSQRTRSNQSVAICFAQFGPYHHARVRHLQEASPFPIVPAQIAGGTSLYLWSQPEDKCSGLHTLCAGVKEQISPRAVFFSAQRFFRQNKILVALLPSYAPATETALFLAAKLCGVTCIMMNESHAGTAKAEGLAKLLKTILVRQFAAGLVGGAPQKRYFTSLGLPEDRIFTGYDAIDNDFFQKKANEARLRREETQEQLQLPKRYFLSLGRLVSKKNLGCLIKAYKRFTTRSTESVSLAIVGSGAEETALKTLAMEQDLRVHDVASLKDTKALGEGDVIFYGFRQVVENPAFYALADAFVLPSHEEEWGLVVNEAMACGLPVVVSEVAGCAEDFVQDGKNGFRFDPYSPDQLSQHLTALAADSTLRESMGAQSRKIIKSWGCENFAANALKAIECAISG